MGVNFFCPLKLINQKEKTKNSLQELSRRQDMLLFTNKTFLVKGDAK